MQARGTAHGDVRHVDTYRSTWKLSGRDAVFATSRCCGVCHFVLLRVCHFVLWIVRELTEAMSGQPDGNTASRTDSGAQPTQVVRLEDLQDTLQAMVDKAIDDRAASRPPFTEDSGEWGI